MERYFIESAKCDVAGDVFFSVVIAEAKIVPAEGKPFYLSLKEVEGTVQFFLTAESTFNLQLDSDDYEEVEQILDGNLLWEGDYEDFFSDKDCAWFSLCRYLVFLVRSDWDDCSAFIARTVGHYIDEIDVPMSDVEEELCDELLPID